MSNNMTLLVVGNDGDQNRVASDAGSVTDVARASGFVVRYHSSRAGRWPSLTEIHAVVVLGSGSGAWDDSIPWITAELEFISEAVRADIPVLGICFGAQILTRAIGGSVEPQAGSEHGITSISITPGVDLPVGPWLEMHFDRCLLPDSAAVLATTTAAVQVFTTQRSMGVQFHPEITPATFQGWQATMTTAEIAAFDAIGVDFDAIGTELSSNAAAYRDGFEAVWRLFLTTARLEERDLHAER